MPTLTRWGHVGAVTLMNVLRVEPWLAIVLFAEMVLLLFYILERGMPSREKPAARQTQCSSEPSPIPTHQTGH